MSRFQELNDTRLLLEQNLNCALASLAKYRDDVSGGFTHLLAQPKESGDFSKASTSTCLAFLDAAGLWTGDWAKKSLNLRNAIIGGRWGSSGLEENNPFTIAFLLEALHVLRNAGAAPSSESDSDGSTQAALVAEKISLLQDAVATGGVAIDPYPPTAFLTYKAVHALQLWGGLRDELAVTVRDWAWRMLNEESVLVASGSQNADVFELAYSVLVASAVARLQDMTPPQRDTIAYTLGQFFDAQSADGAWPRSRPLFLYPRLGNAYCYKYELLVHLLTDHQLRPLMLPRLEHLIVAARALERDRFPLGPGAWGWSSGHLRQVTSAESWSTASVFHYCHVLSDLVGEAVRYEVFDYVGETSSMVDSGERPDPEVVINPNRFLDSDIVFENGYKESLTKVLVDSFLRPLIDNIPAVRRGQPLPPGVPLSGILYGPPGTSKTQLADIIADALAWPLLKLDPSHLTRVGLDQLHAETYRLFSMLGAAERMVVLLDEFDELVREREGPNEALSRFLTTAMLPKLTALRERRKLVFLLATNHVEVFDSAISRPGRFDMIVPVLPPRLDAKLARWPEVATNVGRLKIDFGTDTPLRDRLADLTYAEFQSVSQRLAVASDVREFRAIATDIWNKCTMELAGADGTKWRDRLAAESRRIRIPR